MMSAEKVAAKMHPELLQPLIMLVMEDISELPHLDLRNISSASHSLPTVTKW